MKYLPAPLLLLFLLIILGTPANAGFHVGAAFTDIRLNSPDYMIVKESEPSLSYNVGFSKELAHNLVIDLTTNAPFSIINDANNSDKRNIIIDGKTYLAKSEVTYGSASFGRRFNRLVPSVSASYVQTNTETYLNASVIRERKHAVVFGANMNYFVTEEAAGSLFCLFPSKEINLRFSCGAGINYYF